MSDEIITLEADMQDKTGVLIPLGVKERITVEIADGAYFWKFRNPAITKRWAKLQIEVEKEKGKVNTTLFERECKAGTLMPGKTKEEIQDILVKMLESKGGSVRK